MKKHETLTDLVCYGAQRVASKINAKGTNAQLSFLETIPEIKQEDIEKAERLEYQQEPKLSQEDIRSGIEEIDKAQWSMGGYGWNMVVHDSLNRLVRCYLKPRPKYCDRGHLDLLIDGSMGLDEADSFPRYFFSFEEADIHCRNFLKWRLWKHRVHSHPIIPGMFDMASILNTLKETKDVTP